MQHEGTRMFRVKAVAEMFDVSPATIYRAIESGKLEALKIGRAFRVPEWALKIFENECIEDAQEAMASGQPITSLDSDEASAEVA